MAKFYGKIGYATTVEVKPGIWEDEITERDYYGDVNRISRYLQQTNQVNDNIDIANEFSIVADPFAYQNFLSMRYIEYLGVKWKITKVDASQPPRLILTVGGEYNGR